MGAAHRLVHSCVRYLARPDSKSSSLDSECASLGDYLRMRRGSIQRVVSFVPAIEQRSI